jgi:hypothetical protein
LNRLATAQRYLDCEAADNGFPLLGWRDQIRPAFRAFVSSQAILAPEPPQQIGALCVDLASGHLNSSDKNEVKALALAASTNMQSKEEVTLLMKRWWGIQVLDRQSKAMLMSF